jgi:hypothetical protein
MTAASCRQLFLVRQRLGKLAGTFDEKLRHRAIGTALQGDESAGINAK